MPVTGAVVVPRVEVVPSLPRLTTEDVLAVPVAARGTLPGWLVDAAEPVVDPEWLAGALADTGNGGRPGGITNVPVPGRHPRSVVAVGIGDATLPDLRSYVAVAVRRAQTLAEHGATRLVLPLDSAAGPAGAAEIRAAVEAVLLAGYRFRTTSTPHPPRLRAVLLVAAEADPGAAERGRISADAVLWARDLVATPPDVADPSWLAEQVLARLGGRVDVTVLGSAELAAGGFGGVLALGGGSAHPPQVLVATSRAAAADGRHVVLVGVGTTFDTGGLSIRTTAAMRTSTTDVAGGAAVLAALDAAAALDLPVAITAVVPLVENHVGGSAHRPGDVVTHVGGRTTEVRSTDTGGRLALADALAHARLRLSATALVDLATGTRAATTALGARTGALYASDDALAEGLLLAGEQSGEAWWRMPLTQEHTAHLRPQLDSPLADAHDGPGNPGATTAALFLQPFAGALPWAHLDITGPARAAADAGETVKGGTGFAVRTLLRWLEAGAPCGVALPT